LSLWLFFHVVAFGDPMRIKNLSISCLLMMLNVYNFHVFNTKHFPEVEGCRDDSVTALWKQLFIYQTVSHALSKIYNNYSRTLNLSLIICFLENNLITYKKTWELRNNQIKKIKIPLNSSISSFNFKSNKLFNCVGTK
jgi:hypothetical protein